jgi:oxygen-independent coproporphyrinogen III oxidase
VLPRHLYVHVPFCARRCSYCDFSIAVRRRVPVNDYLDGIRRELAVVAANHATRDSTAWTLDTVYLGGGTPSRLDGDGIAALLDLIREHALIRADAELTIEANPDDVTADAARAWIAAGVNRVSLGAQSFSNTALEWMHRTHDASQIEVAVDVVRSAGVDNVSLDLIFALPSEVSRSWSEDLEKAIDLEPSHVSLYGLTIEPATPLYRWTEQRRVSAPGDDRYSEEFLEAHERMTGAGFTHYEVSNFARPGRESRHNSAYWTGASYLGIGPAAHSFTGAQRSWNLKPYVEWLRLLREGRSVVEGSELLGSESSSAERVYLGLRTTNGFRVGSSDRAVAERLQSAGWAVIDGDLLRLNTEGWLRLDSIASGLTGS